MRKEYLILVIVGVFLFSQVVDFLSGHLVPPIHNPFEFINVLNTYPFTALSVALKSVAIFLSFVIVFSYFKEKYASKALTLFIIAGIAELYSFQQFATGSLLLPPPWVISFAFSGVALLGYSALLFILGMLKGAYNKFVEQPEDVVWKEKNLES